MELTNAVYAYEDDGTPASRGVQKESIETLLKLLHPFTPHITEELWNALGHERTLVNAEWPAPDERALAAEEMTIVVQVNGKLRDNIVVPSDASKEQVLRTALDSEKVRRHTGDRKPKKEIYVPGRLLNLVL
jgi:leucyl-tRNA synthetase